MALNQFPIIMKHTFRFMLWLSLCLSGIGAWAQANRIVTGVVTDEKNKLPLAGVSVSAKGTNIGTITNKDGAFTLVIPDNKDVLIFKLISMKTMEVSIGQNSVVNIAMQDDAYGLNEVVITALGVEKEKKSLGYSSQQITGSEVTGSGEQNFVQGLSSKVAGVQIMGSGGTPGSSSKIIIRGNSSFTGENQPLIIIDGVPMDNSTDFTSASDEPYNKGLEGVNQSNRGLDINPDDIETINVLKGPAAAALYGVRAGNGAIVITTKKGSKGNGKVNVTFSTSYQFDQVNKLPKTQSKYGQGVGGGTLDSSGNYVEGIRKTADPGPDKLYGTNDDVDFGTPNSWGPSLKSMNMPAYDNAGQFFKTGHTVNNNLSISGGSEMGSLRLSLGNTRQDGVIPNTDFTRTTVRLTGETKINNQFSVFGTVNYINSGGTKSQNGSNLSGIMLGLMRAPADFNLAGTGADGYMFNTGTPRQYFYIYDNPYWTANKNPFRDNVNRMLGNFSIKYTPASWINATYRLGTDVYTDSRKQIFSIYSWQPPEPTGQIEENMIRYQEIYSDLLVNMNKNFTKKIQGSLTLGNNLNQRYSQNLYARGRQLAVPNFYNLSNAANLYADESHSTIRTAAVFYDANLSYDKWLYINTTGRNEWASTLGKNKRNFFYPSVSTSIVFTELFKTNGKILSFGKVRMAYAEVGVNPGTPYVTQTYFNRSTYADGFTNGLGFPYLGQNGFGYGSNYALGNPDLRAERKVGTEFGLDLRFFKGRLNFDATYYNQVSKDLVVVRKLPPSSGFAYANVNAGSLRNRGVELVVTGTPVKRKNFSWDITLNYTANRNKVLSVSNKSTDSTLEIESTFESIGSYAIVGQPYGALYGTKWQRNADGKLIIDETTGLPSVAAQRGVIGNPYPKFMMGLRNTFTYKSFTLTFLLDYRKGGDVWCGTVARMNRIGRTEASGDREKMYTIEGVNPTYDGNGNVTGYKNNTTKVSAYDYYTKYVGDAGSAATENAIFDGSWTRLRELGFSYKVPLKNTKVLKSLELNFTGRNLWLKTTYPGVDPETSLLGAGSNVGGYDYFNNPGTKSYIFGLKAAF